MDPATGGAQATHRDLRGNSSKGTSGECREREEKTMNFTASILVFYMY